MKGVYWMEGVTQTKEYACCEGMRRGRGLMDSQHMMQGKRRCERAPGRGEAWTRRMDYAQYEGIDGDDAIDDEGGGGCAPWNWWWREAYEATCWWFISQLACSRGMRCEGGNA